MGDFHCGEVNRRSVHIDKGGPTSQFDWPIAPKKMKLLRLLKVEASVLM